MKVYLVFYESPCECDTTCNCARDSLYGVYKTKELAEDRSDKLYQGSVEEVDVVEA